MRCKLGVSRGYAETCLAFWIRQCQEREAELSEELALHAVAELSAVNRGALPKNDPLHILDYDEFQDIPLCQHIYIM